MDIMDMSGSAPLCKVVPEVGVGAGCVDHFRKS